MKENTDKTNNWEEKEVYFKNNGELHDVLFW
jgi:hypothetical protein